MWRRDRCHIYTSFHFAQTSQPCHHQGGTNGIFSLKPRVISALSAKLSSPYQAQAVFISPQIQPQDSSECRDRKATSMALLVITVYFGCVEAVRVHRQSLSGDLLRSRPYSELRRCWVSGDSLFVIRRKFVDGFPNQVYLHWQYLSKMGT